jgi:hypothetical protein
VCNVYEITKFTYCIYFHHEKNNIDKILSAYHYELKLQRMCHANGDSQETNG